MTFASVATALVSTLAAVPGVRSVERDEQLAVSGKGAVIPTQDRCPLVRLGRSRRYAGRERGETLGGKRERHLPVQCDVWAYVQDQATDADGFLGLVESLQAAVRRNQQLGGAADTAATALRLVRVLDDYGTPRAITVQGKPLLHATFSVDAWEEVTN